MRTATTRQTETQSHGAFAWAEQISLGRGSRVVLVSIVAAMVALEVVWQIAAPEPMASTAMQIALTLSFALFAWRPAPAAIVLVACASATLALDMGPVGALVLAVAAGLVVSTCSRAVIGGYVVAAATLAIATTITDAEGDALEAAVTLLVIVALSSSAGLYLRLMRGRQLMLSRALVEQDGAREAATQIERDRIADELHDLIAHDLTIIAMQAQVLHRTDDAASQEIARRAISDAAQTALADIRRVLHVAQVSRDQPDFDVDTVRNQLLVSIAETRELLESNGVSVLAPDVREISAALPLSIDTALGRIVRETAINVLKHAGSGTCVCIRVELVGDTVRLAVENSGGGRSVDLPIPDGGYGLSRMRARAEALQGSFEAGPTDDGWVVDVRLPVR